MAHLHCRKRTRVRTRIRIPNLMATLYYAEHVHIAQTQDSDPYSLLPYRTGIQVRVCNQVNNVNEPLARWLVKARIIGLKGNIRLPHMPLLSRFKFLDITLTIARHITIFLDNLFYLSK